MLFAVKHEDQLRITIAADCLNEVAGMTAARDSLGYMPKLYDVGSRTPTMMENQMETTLFRSCAVPDPQRPWYIPMLVLLTMGVILHTARHHRPLVLDGNCCRATSDLWKKAAIS